VGEEVKVFLSARGFECLAVLLGDLVTITALGVVRARYAIERLVAEIHGDPLPEPPSRDINRLICRESTAPPPTAQ
jgi:hypothetical protein